MIKLIDLPHIQLSISSELLALAQQVIDSMPTEPEDIEQWALRLGSDLAKFED